MRIYSDAAECCVEPWGHRNCSFVVKYLLWSDTNTSVRRFLQKFMVSVTRDARDKCRSQ